MKIREEDKHDERPVRENGIPPIQDKRKLMCGSMDVKALYPSILKEMSGKAFRQTINKSKAVWDNIDTKQLTRHVAIKVDRKEIVKAKLGEIVPTLKERTTFNSFMNPKGRAKETGGDSQFNATGVVTSQKQIRKLIGLLIANSIEEFMSNHYYTVGGQIRRQEKGGAIGSDLTGETALLYMLTWDTKYLEKLKKLGVSLQLYRRYVDDIILLMNPIRNGWRYDRNRNLLTYSKTMDNVEDESRTMEILRQVADSIDPNIQFTTDSPSCHEDNCMPVLDLKVWTTDLGLGPQLVHSFYKKSVASPFTILERSAMARSTKRNTIYQEALRRLRNISPQLQWDEAIPHMNIFSNMLRISGYSMEYRRHAIGGAIKRMKEVRRLVETGTWASQYRDRKTILETKEQKGGNTPGTWFLKGETTSTIVCTATPDSSLQSHIRRSLATSDQADGGRTLVLEDGGLPVTIGLKKRDPFRSHGCTFGDPSCMVDPKEDCSSQAKVYIITCGGCNMRVEEGPEERSGPNPLRLGERLSSTTLG